jgi:hypothetical protein
MKKFVLFITVLSTSFLRGQSIELFMAPLDACYRDTLSYKCFSTFEDLVKSTEGLNSLSPNRINIHYYPLDTFILAGLVFTSRNERYLFLYEKKLQRFTKIWSTYPHQFGEGSIPDSVSYWIPKMMGMPLMLEIYEERQLKYEFTFHTAFQKCTWHKFIYERDLCRSIYATKDANWFWQDLTENYSKLNLKSTFKDYLQLMERIIHFPSWDTRLSEEWRTPISLSIARCPKKD